jgi:hypothetical protein
MLIALSTDSLPATSLVMVSEKALETRMAHAIFPPGPAMDSRLRLEREERFLRLRASELCHCRGPGALGVYDSEDTTVLDDPLAWQAQRCRRSAYGCCLASWRSTAIPAKGFATSIRFTTMVPVVMRVVGPDLVCTPESTVQR